MPQVKLVAHARKGNGMATAFRDVAMLPEAGDTFQVRDLGYTVLVDRVHTGLKEIHFRLSIDEINRLVHRKDWTNPFVSAQHANRR